LACSNASTQVVKVRTVVSLLAVGSWLLLAVLSGLALDLRQRMRDTPLANEGYSARENFANLAWSGLMAWSGLNARLSKIGSM